MDVGVVGHPERGAGGAGALAETSGAARAYVCPRPDERMTMWTWLRALMTRRPRPVRGAPTVSGRPTPAITRAARVAAQTTGEIVVRTLRLQQLAEEWRRRPSKA